MGKRSRNSGGNSCDTGTNRHHKIPKQYGGSNDGTNIVTMNILQHRGLHFLFDNHVFHQQIQDLIKLMGPTVNKILTDDLQDVIQSYTLEDMYNMKCIKDFDTFVRFVNRK